MQAQLCCGMWRALRCPCCRFNACRLNCAVACGGFCGVHVAGLMHVGSIVLWHVEGFAVSMLQV